MSKGWIIFLVVLAILLVIIIWRRTRKAGKQNRSFPLEIKKQENDRQESGETISNIHSQNYKGVPNDIYYLSYISDIDGRSEIEEASKDEYDQFIKDYPTGIAKGNVIKKYCNERSAGKTN